MKSRPSWADLWTESELSVLLGELRAGSEIRAPADWNGLKNGREPRLVYHALDRRAREGFEEIPAYRLLALVQSGVLISRPPKYPGQEYVVIGLAGERFKSPDSAQLLRRSKR